MNSNKGSVKLAALHEFMVDHQVNITVITESNVAWCHVEPQLPPQEQMLLVGKFPLVNNHTKWPRS